MQPYPFIDRREWVDDVFRARLKIVRILGHVEISWPVAFSNAVPEVNTGAGWTGTGFTPVVRGEDWIIQPLR